MDTYLGSLFKPIRIMKIKLCGEWIKLCVCVCPCVSVCLCACVFHCLVPTCSYLSRAFEAAVRHMKGAVNIEFDSFEPAGKPTTL